MDPSEELRSLRQEAGQLRYELARLRDRRTVRAALAVSAWPRGGARASWAALHGRGPRLDVPGPSSVPDRPPFPHLRVAATGSGALLSGACATVHINPTDAALVLLRDRPDVVLVDGLVGWDRSDITVLLDRAHRSQAAVVTVGAAARAAVGAAALHVDLTGHEPDALQLAPPVDVRAWAPTGLDTAAPAHRIDGLDSVGLPEARRQPVVVAPGAPAARVLEAISAGAVVVTARTPLLEAAFADLDTETTSLVFGEDAGAGEPLEHRARRLLEDDDLRRRVSVRLRRQVHRRCSTHRALVDIIAGLGWDDPPSERISVLLATRRPSRVAQALDDLMRQRHPDVELILLVHGDGEVPDDLPAHAQVQRVPGDRPLGAVLDAGLAHVTGAYVAKMDDDDRYGVDHLGDLVLALRTSGAELVGRRTHGVYLEDRARTIHPPAGGEERFEDHLPGGTLLLPTEVMRSVRWRHVPRAVDTELVRAVHLRGGAAYSSHRYGYVRVRHDDDHTYHAPDPWEGAHVDGFDTSLLEA